MIKEFEINEILNAVDSISNISNKKTKNIKPETSLATKNNDLILNNPVKSEKSKILVLDQMIE